MAVLWLDFDPPHRCARCGCVLEEECGAVCWPCRECLSLEFREDREEVDSE